MVEEGVEGGGVLVTTEGRELFNHHLANLDGAGTCVSCLTGDGSPKDDISHVLGLSLHRYRTSVCLDMKNSECAIFFTKMHGRAAD